MKWINADTFHVDIKRVNKTPANISLTIRYLDPMLVTNTGGLWRNGREIFKVEAHRRGLTKPMIHFFHIGHVREKRSTIVSNGLSCVEYNNCLKTQPKGIKYFELWREIEQ